MAKRRKRLNKLISSKKQLFVCLKVRQQKKKEEEKEEPSSFFQRRRVRCLQIHICDSIFSEVYIIYYIVMHVLTIFLRLICCWTS